jgi:hypothetical protein
MSDTQRGLLPLSAWQALTLRLTVFPGPAAHVDECSGWWEAVARDSPEEVRSKPKTEKYQAEGPFAQGRLLLNVEPLRIDWIYTAIEDPDAPNPWIGPFEENLKEFQKLASRWFELEEPLSANRLAFGAELLSPVETLEIGYRQLSLYLPFDLDPTDVSDFLYQINRHRDSHSGVEGLSINRLTRWSVAMFWRERFLIPPLPTGRQVQRLHKPTYSYACRLGLDISTPSEFEGELSPQEQSTVFEELVALGVEIVREGDIP